MRCSVCSSPQVKEVDVLIASGTPIRQVARLTGFARTTLARHREHVRPLEGRFGVIRGQDGPNGPADPLAEALALAERARTPRERLRALEQVRGATKLALRGAEALDDDGRELLDRNVRDAERAYRDAVDFETQARALSGWREALRQRITAVKTPEAVAAPIIDLTFYDVGEPPPEAPLTPASVDDRDVPARFRDPRFGVRRTVTLSFVKGTPDTTLKVYERATGALVWKEER
jgi:hypothetical protein